MIRAVAPLVEGLVATRLSRYTTRAVALAPITVAARELANCGDPLGVLAELLSATDAEFARRFAARADVTLAAFG